MSTAAAAVATDRERIAAILNLPEAKSNVLAAVRIALAGVSVDDARIALAIMTEPMSPNDIAAAMNGGSPR